MIRRSSQSSWWDIDFKQIAMVALQGAVVLFTIFTISAITVRLMYRSFIPQPLLREKLYFDFRLPSPLASLRLQGAQNQWDYVGALSESHTRYAKPAYLIPGRAYDISLQVVFAKSPRNLALGKAVFSVTLQDTAGDTIANSVRTVSYIYRSPYFTFLQDISTFGFELIGLSGYPVSLQQQASIMETYVEPSGHPPTHVVNVEISTNEVDVYDAYLIIAPKMSWLMYVSFHRAERVSFLFVRDQWLALQLSHLQISLDILNNRHHADQWVSAMVCGLIYSGTFRSVFCPSHAVSNLTALYEGEICHWSMDRPAAATARGC